MSNRDFIAYWGSTWDANGRLKNVNAIPGDAFVIRNRGCHNPNEWYAVWAEKANMWLFTLGRNTITVPETDDFDEWQGSLTELSASFNVSVSIDSKTAKLKANAVLDVPDTDEDTWKMPTGQPALVDDPELIDEIGGLVAGGASGVGVSSEPASAATKEPGGIVLKAPPSSPTPRSSIEPISNASSRVSRLLARNPFASAAPQDTLRRDTARNEFSSDMGAYGRLAFEAVKDVTDTLDHLNTSLIQGKIFATFFKQQRSDINELINMIPATEVNTLLLERLNGMQTRLEATTNQAEETYSYRLMTKSPLKFLLDGTSESGDQLSRLFDNLRIHDHDTTEAKFDAAISVYNTAGLSEDELGGLIAAEQNMMEVDTGRDVSPSVGKGKGKEVLQTGDTPGAGDTTGDTTGAGIVPVDQTPIVKSEGIGGVTAAGSPAGRGGKGIGVGRGGGISAGTRRAASGSGSNTSTGAGGNLGGAATGAGISKAASRGKGGRSRKVT